MNRQFDTKLFCILAAAFVFATVVGTLSHEAGHAIVGKCEGYRPRVHYAYTTLDENALDDSIYAIWVRHHKEIDNGLAFRDQDRFKRLVHKSSDDDLWFVIGGPAETMIVGSIGLLLLFASKRSFRQCEKLRDGHWVLIFMALFWLRQTANLVVWLGSYLITKKFSQRGDEIKLATTFGFPFWFLAVITGLLGFVVLAVVLFKFVPSPQRLTFIAAGLVGGVAGYIIWLDWLGPILLP